MQSHASARGARRGLRLLPMKYFVILLVVVVAFLAWRAKSRAGGSGAADVADWTRVIDTSEQRVLLDFWKPHCPGCEKMEPIVATMERDYPNMQVIRVNTDLAENRALHDRFAIRGTPTFIVVRKGRILARNDGPFRNKQDFLSFVRPSGTY